MAQITWSDISNHFVSHGLSHGVIYPAQGVGQPWDGLISIELADSPSETRSYFLEGQKVFQDPEDGDFRAAIQAFIYPDILHTSKSGFGLSYRTYHESAAGRDYTLHILYNVGFVMKDRNYTTLELAETPVIFEWDVFNLPARADGFKAGAHLTIDSRTAYPWLITELESILYGDETRDPRLPDLGEMLDIFEDNAILKITDHGDGTWSAEGPPVYFLSGTEFAIDWPSVVYLNEETYQVKSL